MSASDRSFGDIFVRRPPARLLPCGWCGTPSPVDEAECIDCGKIAAETERRCEDCEDGKILVWEEPEIGHLNIPRWVPCPKCEDGLIVAPREARRVEVLAGASLNEAEHARYRELEKAGCV